MGLDLWGNASLAEGDEKHKIIKQSEFSISQSEQKGSGNGFYELDDGP